MAAIPSRTVDHDHVPAFLADLKPISARRAALRRRRAHADTALMTDPATQVVLVNPPIKPTVSQRSDSSDGPGTDNHNRTRTGSSRAQKSKTIGHTHTARSHRRALHNCTTRRCILWVPSAKRREAAHAAHCRAILFVAGLSASLVALSLRFISYSLSAGFISLSAGFISLSTTPLDIPKALPL